MTSAASTAATSRRRGTSFTGTWMLVMAALRRDRVLIAAWVATLLTVVYASAAATGGLYSTYAGQLAAARAINGSPAIVALYGPILDETSLGELSMTKVTVLYTVFLALLFVVLVRRHTRAEEENGHAELLGGTAIGGDALLAAAIVEGVLVALVTGALAAVADVLGGLPVAGSLIFGAGWAGIGLVAVGVAAVACQLSASSRTCFAIATGAIGVLYALRAVGDVGPGALSWMTPFGWATQLRAWSDPRWWVLVLDVALALLLVLVARGLRNRRDLGAGLIQPRPGPAQGGPRLDRALALAWRVHQPALWTWSIGVAAMGTVMGAIAPGVGDLLDGEGPREMIARLGGAGSPQDSVLAAVFSIAGVIITCYAISVVAHGGGDERDGITEQVLATATSRTQAFLANTVVALGGAVWLLLVLGTATGLSLVAQGSDTLAGMFGVVAAALVQGPAVLVAAALALLLYAVRSGWAGFGWWLLGGFFVLGLVGDLLSLPDGITGLSPFSHIPAMPVDDFDGVPLLLMTMFAGGLVGLSWWRFRERDLG